MFKRFLILLLPLALCAMDGNQLYNPLDEDGIPYNGSLGKRDFVQYNDLGLKDPNDFQWDSDDAEETIFNQPSEFDGEQILSSLWKHPRYKWQSGLVVDTSENACESSLSVVSTVTNVSPDAAGAGVSGFSSKKRQRTENIKNHEESLSCREKGCSSKFTSRKAYCNHMNVHNGTFKCNEPTCKGPCFESKERLYDHNRRVHSAAKLICQNCKSNFDLINSFRRHKKNSCLVMVTNKVEEL